MRCPACSSASPFALKPVAQGSSRKTIVSIVERDRILDAFTRFRRLPQFQGVFHLTHCPARFLQGHRPPKAVKHLERLERILLHAGAKGSLQDGVKIDEQSRSQHPVDFVLTRRMPAHEPLQSRGLVGCEMVDMHRRIFRPARHNRIDKPFERPLFLFRRHRPAAVIGLLDLSDLPRRSRRGIPVRPGPQMGPLPGQRKCLRVKAPAAARDHVHQ